MATLSVFFPGKSHGQRSLVGYNPWDGKNSDVTKATLHTCTHSAYHSVCLWCPLANLV